jgi:hypothetical protein
LLCLPNTFGCIQCPAEHRAWCTVLAWVAAVAIAPELNARHTLVVVLGLDQAGGYRVIEGPQEIQADEGIDAEL